MLILQKLTEECKKLLPISYSLPTSLYTLKECSEAIFKAALHYIYLCTNKDCDLLPKPTKHNLGNISKFYFTNSFKTYLVPESEQKEWIYLTLETDIFYPKQKLAASKTNIFYL